MNQDFVEENDELEELEILDSIENYNLRGIYERNNHFYGMTNKGFFIRFSLSKDSVHDILVLIENQLEHRHDLNNSVSPMNQILVCLRNFATGGHLQSVADSGGMHDSTVSRIVARVSEAVARLRLDLSNFQQPDCTHIKIQFPNGEDAEIFRNGKSYFSVNVQAVGNARY